MKVECMKCKHFVVTWQPKYPYSCRLLGFKSAKMPSHVAFEATGAPCAAFESKYENAPQNEKGVIIDVKTRI